MNQPNKKPTIGKKPPLSKKIERKFYKTFNDKSFMRRISFSVLLASMPAVMISNVLEEDPSTKPDSAAQQAAYIAEIAEIKSTIPTEVFTLQKAEVKKPLSPEATAKMAEVQKKSVDFSTRMILDTKLSEQDIYKISYSFNNQLGDYTKVDNITNMRKGSPYVEEAREKLAQDPTLSKAPDDKKAEMISEQADEKGVNNHLTSIFIFFALFSVFDDKVRNALRNGRRRDDDNIQEETEEKFADAKDGLRDILTPKNPPKPK